MPKEKEISEEETETNETESKQEDEEEGLEEELEDMEIPEIPNLEFSSFIQPIIEESAPILERLAGSQGVGFSLSGWEALSSPVTSEGTIKEEDPFKYSVGGGGEAGEAKYISSEQAGAIPERVDVSRVGREQLTTPEINQEAFFTQSSETRAGESMSVEKYEPAQRIDKERAGRRDPLKADEKKYEFKPPKS